MPGINPFPERLPDDRAKAIAEKRTAAEKEKAGMFSLVSGKPKPSRVSGGLPLLGAGKESVGLNRDSSADP